MCGVAGQTDYATPGAARRRVDHKVGVPLEPACSQEVQYRCEPVSGCCEVRVKNSLRALNLQIQPAAFSARGR